MVATEPQFRNRLEMVVVGHHLGHQVTMVIDDRQLGRMFVVQILGQFGLQNEVLVIELLHKSEYFKFLTSNFPQRYYFSAKLSLSLQKNKSH